MSAGIGMTGIYIVLLIAILIVCAVVCFVVIKSRSELREGRKALTLMAMAAEKRGESTQSFIDEARARGAAADQFMADAEQRAQTVDSFIHDAKAGMVLIDSDILETKAYNEALAAEAYEKLAVLDENLSRIDETVNGIGEKVGELDLKEIIRAASQAAVMPRQISVEPIRKPVREKKVVMIDDRLAAPLQESGKVVSEAAEQAAEQAAETAENDAIVYEIADARTREDELGDLGLIWDSGKETGVWDLEPEQITKADIPMPSVRRVSEDIKHKGSIEVNKSESQMVHVEPASRQTVVSHEPRPAGYAPIPKQTAPEEKLEMREFLKDVRSFRERRDSGRETEPVEDVIYGKKSTQEPPAPLRLAKFTDRDSGVDKDGNVFTVEQLRMQIR